MKTINMNNVQSSTGIKPSPLEVLTLLIANYEQVMSKTHIQMTNECIHSLMNNPNNVHENNKPDNVQ